MSAVKHTPGDEVYSIHGEAGRYVASCASGHIVEPIWEDGDGDPSYADAVTWREVFTKPPVQKLQAEVAAVEKALAVCRAALEKVRAERREFDGEERARLARIKAHEELAQLDEFLAGRITHFVVLNDYYAPKVKTFEETMRTQGEDRYNPPLRLLGLFGDPKRNLQWKVMSYSDGSGGSRYEVIPCTSLEQASAKQVELINGAWPRVLKAGNYSELTEHVKTARQLGLAVPQEAADRADAIERESAEKNLKSRREEMARAEANLRDAEAAIAKAGSTPS